MRLPDPPDLATTRRIIEAAIDLFARDGYAGTTVRRVAAAAEVSAGLIIHRFGDKAGLRKACDDAVLAQLAELQTAHLLRTGHDDLDAFAALRHQPEMVRLVDYLAQMVLDRSPGADHLFDALVARTRTALAGSLPGIRGRPSDDPEAQAVLVAAHGLVEVIWRHQLARLLGTPDDPDGTARLIAPTLQLYTEGVLELDPSIDPKK